MKFRGFTILALWFSAEVTCYADHGVLRIYTEEFPPYNYTDKNDELVGINAQIVRKACEMSHIKCEFLVQPWARSFRDAQEDPLGAVFSTSRQPHREHLFDWVGPLVSSQSCLFKLKVRDDIPSDDLAALTQFKIGFAKQYAYLNVLQQNGFIRNQSLLEFPSRNAEAKALVSGRVDLIMGSILTLPFQLKDTPIRIDELAPVVLLDDPSLRGNYLALNKRISPKLRDALQSSINELRASEFFTKQVSEYVAPELIVNEVCRPASSVFTQLYYLTEPNQ